MPDFAERINRYESGKLDYDETVDLFQELVDTGVAWELHGSYEKTAQALIDSGEVMQL